MCIDSLLQHLKIKNCPSSDALLQPVFPELDCLSYVASNDHDSPCRCISNLITAVKQAAKYIVLYDSLQTGPVLALPAPKCPALNLCCSALQASRPKLALWRSARERGIWMRDMAAAHVSTSAAEVAYLAAVLSDK